MSIPFADIKRTEKGQFVKGYATYGTTHGMYGTPFYFKYHGARQHCRYPKSNRYKDYGGRGIKLLWKSFEEFRDDMYESYLRHVKEHGEKNTTIDRIDVNGHYCKENCRWATMQEQARNKRNNRLLTVGGVTKNLSVWAEESGLDQTTIMGRLARGWTPEKAILSKRFNKHDKYLIYTFKGETMTLKQWAKKLGIKYHTLYARLFTRKIPLEEAFTKKVL